MSGKLISNVSTRLIIKNINTLLGLMVNFVERAEAVYKCLT